MTVLAAFVLWITLLGGNSVAQNAPEPVVSILAVGDINLGRSVGQILLKDSLEYPFELSGDVLRSHDIVFANLESQITDQGGVTQHPTDRYIFSAPPQAAQTLRKGGVTVVSTANNHAFDYGASALIETLQYLSGEGIASAGTSKDSVSVFVPALLEVHGLKVGFVAYTEFVNQKGPWQGNISLFHVERAQKEIGNLKRSADLVVASYHGGTEYTEQPSKTSRRQMRALVDAGADIVLGHHPHVPQGIERYAGKLIFYSLGNFMFLQPQREWTQKSFAVSMKIRKQNNSAVIEEIRLLPLLSGNQPSFAVPPKEREDVLLRLMKLSSVPLSRKDSVLVVSYHE